MLQVVGMAFLAACTLLASSTAGGAALTVHVLPVPSAEGEPQVRCYSQGPLDAAMPVVVLLHGAGGFARFARHYESYAQSFARRGLRTCAILYYSPEDARIVASGDATQRSALFGQRFAAWHAAINLAVDRLRALPSTESPRIGVLGFSQGGYLAVAVAGTNAKVKALAEFYGGFPYHMEGQITRLPPTLIVHGKADTVIPVDEALLMAAYARNLAESHTIKVYPRAGHSFDSRRNDSAAADARKLTTDFFVRHLAAQR